MTYKGYLARLIDADGTGFDDLRDFAEHPSCPPEVRDHVREVLHDHEMAKRAVQTNRARMAAQAALNEIENVTAPCPSSTLPG